MNLHLDLTLTNEQAEALRVAATQRGVPIEALIQRAVEHFLEEQVDTDDDALWEESFANSQDFLEKLAKEGEALYREGLTEDFDPDTDPDLQ